MKFSLLVNKMKCTDCDSIFLQEQVKDGWTVAELVCPMCEESSCVEHMGNHLMEELV